MDYDTEPHPQFYTNLEGGVHPRGRYECSPRAVGFYMWTFSSWEIIAAHRRACKPKQEHYVARRLWGFRHTDAVEACLRPARWARNGHLLSDYYLKNISNRIWRKELKWDSERMSKCETPPFIKSPPSLCSVFFSLLHILSFTLPSINACSHLIPVTDGLLQLFSVRL